MTQTLQFILDRSSEILFFSYIGYQLFLIVDYLFITHKDTMNENELIYRYVKLVEKRKGKVSHGS